MKYLLRIRCYYCDERLELDFFSAGNRERAHLALRDNGWIFGCMKEDGKVLFDPLCNTCGRGVVEQMLSQGGSIDEDAKRHLLKVFPDLFEAN